MGTRITFKRVIAVSQFEKKRGRPQCNDHHSTESRYYAGHPTLTEKCVIFVCLLVVFSILLASQCVCVGLFFLVTDNFGHVRVSV